MGYICLAVKEKQMPRVTATGICEVADFAKKAEQVSCVNRIRLA